MVHTYFMSDRQWQASGTYYDGSGRTFDLTGQSLVTRGDDDWTLEASMEVLLKAPVKLFNRYTIHSTDFEHTLAWTSINPALGELSGTFSIIGSYIISVYTSQDGTYSGSETLMQIDENTYNNVGVAFHNGQRLSAWTALLRAKPVFA